jgi:hypothetical protein
MTEAVPSYRLKLPCSDEREFREKFVQKYVTRGVFVPSERPKPVGTRLKLKLEIRGGVVLVSGDGMVTSCTQPGGTAKPGMTVRLTMLHPESIQFDLSPAGGSPATTPSGGLAPASSKPQPPPPQAAVAKPVHSPPPVPPALTPSPGHRAAPPPPPAPPQAPPPPAPSLRATEHEDLFNLDDDIEPMPPAAPALPDEGAMAVTDPAIPVPSELLVPEPAPQAAPEAPPPTPKPRRTAPSRTFVVAVVAGLAVVGGVTAATVVSSRSGRAAREIAAQVDEQLRIADLRLGEGRLADARGDSALDHLLQAKGISAQDARVGSRLKLLADKFEQLGDRAVTRKNLREAAVHYRAAVMADPARANARARLDELEAKLRGPAPSP